MFWEGRNGPFFLKKNWHELFLLSCTHQIWIMDFLFVFQFIWCCWHGDQIDEESPPIWSSIADIKRSTLFIGLEGIIQQMHSEIIDVVIRASWQYFRCSSCRIGWMESFLMSKHVQRQIWLCSKAGQSEQASSTPCSGLLGGGLGSKWVGGRYLKLVLNSIWSSGKPAGCLNYCHSEPGCLCCRHRGINETNARTPTLAYCWWKRSTDSVLCAMSADIARTRLLPGVRFEGRYTDPFIADLKCHGFIVVQGGCLLSMPTTGILNPFIAVLKCRGFRSPSDCSRCWRHNAREARRILPCWCQRWWSQCDLLGGCLSTTKARGWRILPCRHQGLLVQSMLDSQCRRETMSRWRIEGGRASCNLECPAQWMLLCILPRFWNETRLLPLLFNSQFRASESKPRGDVLSTESTDRPELY
jgi:hypothetical protein